MYIILNWFDGESIEDATTVCKEDGSGDALVFSSKAKAESYAEDNITVHWKVVHS